MNEDRLSSRWKNARRPMQIQHFVSWLSKTTPGNSVFRGYSSSYWYYLSNQGFFWGIFRDINPIATRQAWGWEFRGFLAWSFALVFCLYIEAQSDS
jgi:hypothetical protein